MSKYGPVHRSGEAAKFGEAHEALPILLGLPGARPRKIAGTIKNDLCLFRRHDAKHDKALAGTTHPDGGASGHLDLYIAVLVVGVMNRMAARIKPKAQGFGGDNLANRTDKMSVWRELATGLGGLKLVDSPIDRGDWSG